MMMSMELGHKMSDGGTEVFAVPIGIRQKSGGVSGDAVGSEQDIPATAYRSDMVDDGSGRRELHSDPVPLLCLPPPSSPAYPPSSPWLPPQSPLHPQNMSRRRRPTAILTYLRRQSRR